MVLRKEGYDRYWYYFCDLLKNDWMTVNHEPGNKWTIDRLKNQAITNTANKWKGTAKRVVKECSCMAIASCINWYWECTAAIYC